MPCCEAKPSLFALIEGNNFHVNCQRVFGHSLEGRPVVVLRPFDSANATDSKGRSRTKILYFK